MTYRLFNRVGSAGLSIEAALRFAELPFELVEIDSRAGEPMPDSFRDINPLGQVPVLLLPDGETLTEASAILIYLLSAHPQSRLGPAPGDAGYARFVRWVIFCSVNIHEAESRMVYPSRFTTNSAAEAATQEAAEQRMVECLQILNNALESGPCLLGQNMTAADIYIAMFYGWNSQLADLPRLQILFDTVVSNDVVATVFNRHNVS